MQEKPIPARPATLSPSKPIRKTEDQAMTLIKDLLGGKDTRGFNVDSAFFHEKHGWTIIEFLRCETVRPHSSHPNRYWVQCRSKVTALWRMAQALGGVFFWVTYEDSREQFSVITIIDVDYQKGVTKYERVDMNLDQFRAWYNDLNDNPGSLW